MIINLLIGFVVGFILAKIKMHEHDYEVLFHRPSTNLPNLSLMCDREQYGKVNWQRAYITYRKCRTCGDVDISVSDGSIRKFYFDANHYRTHIEVIMRLEQEKKDKELLARADQRLLGDTPEATGPAATPCAS